MTRHIVAALVFIMTSLLSIGCSNPVADSANGDLSALSLDAGILTPAFSPTTTAYTAQVTYTDTLITITAQPADEHARLTVSPPQPCLLNRGVNVVTITVTAQNRATKVYTVAVTRAVSPHRVTVPNGDFETSDRVWTTGHTAGTTCAFSIDSHAHAGMKAGQLTVTGGGYCQIHNSLDFIQIDDSGSYTLELYWDIDGTPSYTGICVYQSSTPTFPLTVVKCTTITSWRTGYHKYVLDKILLSAGDYVRVGVGVGAEAGNDARLYVDDISLYK